MGIRSWSLRIAAGSLALLALSVGAPATAQDNPQLGAFENGIVEGDESDAVPRAKILELIGEARIAGATSDVTLEFLLGTEGPGTDEIRLDLALPRGAVVTGYALDVEGVLIPGVLLDQPRARNVYEDEVREGIDPGLAEVSIDRFSTRVFPVTAEHPRRIRVRFSAPFDPAVGLALPLRSAAPVRNGRFTVIAQGLAEAPDVRFDGSAVALARKGSAWEGSVALSGHALGGGLAVGSASPARPLLLATHASGEAFFLIADSADGAPEPVRQGGRLRIYWDRSLSHGRDRVEREIAMLVRLAAKAAPEAIDLVTFASDAPRVEALADAAALRAALERVTYRGGTSFAGLDALELPEARQCVLLSDGRATIDLAAEFTPDCALAAVSASATADTVRLARLGRFVALPEGAEDAVAELLARPVLQVLSARDETGRRLPFRALPAAGNGWLLTGQAGDAREVRLRIALPDGRTVQRGYLVRDDAIAADAPGALWAASEIGLLQDDPKRHDELLRFARRYSVAGSRLAFLVLESPEQYISAEVAPPEGFPREWRESYAAQKRELDHSLAQARRDRFEFVLEEWRERRAWWGKTYKAARRAPRGRNAEDEGASDALEVIAPAPMPSPPPPAPSAVPGDRPPASSIDGLVDVVPDPNAAYDDGADAIVVTGTYRGGPSYTSPSPITVIGEDTLGEVALEMEDLLGDQPYLAALDAAAAAQRLAVLAGEQASYGTLPGFFLDTAEWFRLEGDLATSHLLLLSALELPEADDETRQVVAFRLERDGALDRAVELAEIVAAGSQFRPQPKRALALALAARGAKGGAGARRDLERAFRLLTEVALEPALGDFRGIEVIALMEANALLPALEAAGGEWALDPQLVGLLETDLRVVIEWTADDADIDLWVDEPNGERVMYSYSLSTGGGQISNDMTDGYGPEEYAIRRAPRGSYRVRVNGYDADRINPNGAGRVLVRLIRDFGRPGQREELVDAGLGFQRGRNRDEEDEALPVAVLEVRASRR